MVDTPHNPPSIRRNGGNEGGRKPSRIHEEYHPETLSSQQREELHHHNMEALHTPIVGETSEAQALEAVRLATLAELTRLENLQHTLDERARRQIPESSRRQQQLFPPEPQVYRTLIQNLTAAAHIAESI